VGCVDDVGNAKEQTDDSEEDGNVPEAYHKQTSLA
jgi:hypothetical protein